jgi:UDP-N-acetylglucosamine--N-acetylmuramyl-(pentapeptide) pyrophosphoryl-undecaprenol N-acetylglucosamine transferase
MIAQGSRAARVAIACGGTGGHLFPGIAVADQLVRRGCQVTLLISPKEVDQQAVKQARGMEILTLPAIGLTRGRMLAFARGFAQSYATAVRAFRPHPPVAALAMGGFTSAPPILAARRFGARTFLHDSNTIPGRANRWLSWVVHRAFVGFPMAGRRLHARAVSVTGTPVRPQFQPRSAAECRVALGLEPDRPVVLVMGGSQGASGINELVLRALSLSNQQGRNWQWFHLAGPADAEKVRQAYAAAGLKAVVHPFFASMELALGAATAAISRSGASSMAEIAAMRLPSVLVPFPAATDDHQLFNARAFEGTGAARLLVQKTATPEALMGMLSELMEEASAQRKVREALARWHAPRAAEEIAEIMLHGLTGAKVVLAEGIEQGSSGAAGADQSRVAHERSLPPHPGPAPRGAGKNPFASQPVLAGNLNSEVSA